MKQKLFLVKLIGFTYHIWAFNEKEAIILAQAKGINDAVNYELVSIERIE